MHYLVMWSGGIDSTYSLVKLLKETDHKVTALHVCLRNAEGRDQAETLAIQELMPKLQEIREFNYLEVLIDESRLGFSPWDMQHIGAYAGIASKGHSEKPGLIRLDRWTIGTHKSEGHWKTRWASSIEQIAKGYAWPKDCAEFELLPMATKREEIDYLKRLSLFNSTWFCRTPVSILNGDRIDISNCEKCKTCAEVRQALEEK